MLSMTPLSKGPAFTPAPFSPGQAILGWGVTSNPAPRDRSQPAPPLLLAETGAAILAASLMVRLVPFRTLASWLSSGARGHVAADAETAYWLRRSILAWARRLPWRALCFEQGVAAHLLLRRRRLASTLHYGAATTDGKLQAHVWVTSGETPLVGCENRDDFHLLARF